MAAVTLTIPAALPALTVTPSQLAVTASDSISTRQASAAVVVSASGSSSNTNANRSAAANVTASAIDSNAAQDSVAVVAQSLPQQENIPGVVGITTQEAQFTPDVQYNALVADSFIKYKPSYAGLPQTVTSALRAYNPVDATASAPQVTLEG